MCAHSLGQIGSLALLKAPRLHLSQPSMHTRASLCFVAWPHWTRSMILGCGEGSAAWLGQGSSCCLGSACSLCPTKRKGWAWILSNFFFFFWSFLKEKSLPYSDFFIKKNKNKKEEGDSSQIILWYQIYDTKTKREEDYRLISLMNKDTEVLTKLPNKI